MNKKKIGIGVLGFFLLIVLKFVFTQPSHDRDWIEEQAVLPQVEFLEGSQVKVSSVRDFHYNQAGDLVIAYKDVVYNLDALEGVDFVYSRFSDAAAVAHTFVTFRFIDQEPLAISIESRREKDETYSPLKGLFQAYEEIYILATERDLIGRRSHIKKEEVYLFPSNAGPEKSRELLVSMLEYVQELQNEPVFYNTLTNQCTSKLAKHIRQVSGGQLPLSYKILLPGYSDQLAYESGFLKNDIPFEDLKKQSLIDPERIDLNNSDFSKKIRE